jgi:hypothetical protein
MKNISVLILGVFLLVCFSCQDQNRAIDYLDVYFLPEGTTTQIPIHCDMLYGDWKPKLVHRKIENSKILKQFEDYYNSYLENKEEKTQDLRIRCMIYLKNGRVDTLCLGEYFDTFLNGQRMNDSNELLNLLKKELDYSNISREQIVN